MISGDCNFRLGTKKASRELRSGLEGDVFFLDRGIDRDFHLLGGFPVQRHRNFKDQARSIFADSFAKIDEVGEVAGKVPLETDFATKGLKIGIGNPGIDYPLVAEVFQLLEQQEPDHEPDWLGWASGLTVKVGEFVLEALPGDIVSQLEQGMSRVELVQEVRCRFARDFALMTAPRSAQTQPVFCGFTAVPGRGRYIENNILLSIFRLMDRFQGRLHKITPYYPI